jgi:hypothetical protein
MGCNGCCGYFTASTVDERLVNAGALYKSGHPSKRDHRRHSSETWRLTGFGGVGRPKPADRRETPG